MKYRREIDGLRAIAVLPVIFYHAGTALFSGGYVGVDVFFVISGYLITTIILTERRDGRFSLLNFYERRARRILPALLFVMIACLPLAWRFMTPAELSEFSASVVAVAFFYSNVFFWLDSGYFAAAAEMKPLLHTWSLAVEEQYYLLFPLLILATWRFGQRGIVAILAALCLASLALAQHLAFDFPNATFYLLHTRLWELLVGSLTAVYMLDREPQSGVREEMLAALGLTMILYSIIAFDAETPFPSLYALLPTLGTALIIVNGSAKTLTGRLLSVRLLVGIGLISYSAYLWHQPLFAYGRLATNGEPDMAVMALLGAVALLLAAITWKFVEQPFRNKDRFGRATILRGAVVGTMVLALTGFTGHLRDGDPARFSEQQLAALASIESLRAERRRLNRAELCHFTEQNEHGLEHFLANWDCWSSDDGLTRIPVVVTGDSHAADIYVALRTNGLMPLQIGGTGCSLNPDFMTTTCRRLFDKLADAVAKDPDLRYLVLANRFSRNELSLASLEKTVNYWERFDLDIILFSAMPQFTRFERALLNSLEPRPDFALADYSLREEAVDYLAGRGVHVVDRKAVFCSIAKNCDFRDEHNRLLVVDFEHLSGHGAQRFGAQLLQSDELFRGLVN